MKIIFIILLPLITACATNKEFRPLNGTDSIPQVEADTENPASIFFTELKTPWVIDLADKANCVINHSEYISAIQSKASFDYSEQTGADVYSRMKKVTCGIRLYATKNPWSSAIATTYATDRQYLYLNSRKNPRPLPQMMNTVIHECSHLAGYKHGDNSPVGKENSVPYWIGDKAEKIAAKCME